MAVAVVAVSDVSCSFVQPILTSKHVPIENRNTGLLVAQYNISNANVYTTGEYFEVGFMLLLLANWAPKSAGPDLPQNWRGAHFAGARFAEAQFAWNCILHRGAQKRQFNVGIIQVNR